MFGPDLLVAPILEADAQSRKVYLPSNTLWKDAWTGQQYEGRQWIDVPVKLQTIPLFLKADSSLIGFNPYLVLSCMSLWLAKCPQKSCDVHLLSLPHVRKAVRDLS